MSDSTSEATSENTSDTMSHGNLELLDDRGYTSKVYRIAGTQKVCKVFHEKCQTKHFIAEKNAYERFEACNAPPSILKYYGTSETQARGLIFELAEKGTLRDHIWQCSVVEGRPASPDLIYRWARQAAEGLSFAHSCGVYHADIYCANFLLDADLNLKLADFAGASIDGSTSWSFYRFTHRLFERGDDGDKGMTISVKTEVFALGSAMYSMVQGHDPFVELERSGEWAELVRRVQEKEMPDTSGLPILGEVISRCWNLEYRSMEEVLEGIEANRSRHIDQTPTQQKR